MRCIPCLSRLPRSARWILLILLSFLFAGLLTWARLPAALMLGAMMAAIMVEAGRASIRLPQLPFALAQGIIGCMIAKALTADIVHFFIQNWPICLGFVLTVVLFSCLLGWAISGLNILPGTTAIWGLLPGTAAAIMIMSESYGADGRLIAFMTYLASCWSRFSRRSSRVSGFMPGRTRRLSSGSRPSIGRSFLKPWPLSSAASSSDI